MKRYQNILWDWNGTLLDDVDECIEIINVSLANRKLKTIDRTQYLEKFQFPVKKYYEEIGFNFSLESFEKVGREYIDAYATRMFECRLHDSAVEILQRLSLAGKKQYILSALNHAALQKCIGEFGLARFFEEARGLDDHYAHSKVELGRTLMADLGIACDSAVLIGDTLHDYEVAQDLGIDCILIAAGHNSRKRLDQCDTKIFADLRELNAKIGEIL